MLSLLLLLSAAIAEATEISAEQTVSQSELAASQPGKLDTLPQPIEVTVDLSGEHFDVLRNLGPHYSIVRPAPGMTYLYRYNCGGDSIVDVNGNVWMGDDTRYSRCWASHPEYKLEEMTPVMGTYGIAEETLTIKTQSALMFIDEREQPLLGTYRVGRKDLGFRFPVSSYQSYSVEVYLLCMPHSPQNTSWLELRFNNQLGRLPVVASSGIGGHSRVGKCTFLIRSGSLNFIDVSVHQGRAVICAIAISTLPEIATMSDEVPRPEGQGFPYSEGLTWEKLRQRDLLSKKSEMLVPNEE